MDVESQYSTDVTIRESDEYVKSLTSHTTKRKGRGFHDSHDRDEIHYQPISGQFNQGPLKSIQGWILLVTNIHQETNDEDIFEKFGEFGTVQNLHLNIDKRTGYVKGYALIEYETYKEAERAQQQNGKLILHGQALGINWAYSSGPLYSKT